MQSSPEPGSLPTITLLRPRRFPPAGGTVLVAKVAGGTGGGRGRRSGGGDHGSTSDVPGPGSVPGAVVGRGLVVDEWWYAADLPNCQELMAAFEARRGPAAPGGRRPRRAHKCGPAAGPEPPLIPSPRSTPFSTPSPSEADRADAFLHRWHQLGRPPR